MLNLPGAKEDHTEDSVLEEREKSSLGKAKGKRPPFFFFFYFYF